MTVSMVPKGEIFPEDMPASSKRIDGGMSSPVPESEIEIEFARSSGPGGQNVNKRSTKAVLSWDIGASQAFDERQKAILVEALGNRINSEGKIVLSADSERSQERNRKEAIGRLQELVAEALTPRKERKATKVSRKEKKRRLEDKRKRGDLKKLRKSIKDWE